MDLLCLINQTEKDEYYVISLIFKIYKVIQMNVYVKQNKLWLPKGRGEGEGQIRSMGLSDSNY